MTDNRLTSLTQQEQDLITMFLNADAETQRNVEKLLTGKMSIEEAEAIYNISLHRS